jgi:hypothetical protein
MNKIEASCFVVCALLLLGAGCAETQRHVAVENICVPGINKAEAMLRVEQVLGEMLFRIDKADAEHGYILTQPLRGAQFFEFWRSDNVGASNQALANLHSIRRTAELNVSQQEDELCISCEVRTQRLSLPERRLSSTARAYMMFSKSTSRMQRLELGPEQRKRAGWIDLGQDDKLAGKILERVEKKLAAQSKTVQDTKSL